MARAAEAATEGLKPINVHENKEHDKKTKSFGRVVMDQLTGIAGDTVSKKANPDGSGTVESVTDYARRDEFIRGLDAALAPLEEDEI